MVKDDDFIHLNYTPDLTEAGISYALRHLAYPFREEGESALRRFQMMVVNKAVELAFRRYLSEQGIPSETISGRSFGSLDEYQLILGGWHCDFESSWLGQPGLIRQVRSQPGSLLKAAALVPSERVVAWAPGEKGVCIFAFVIGQNPADHSHPHQAHSFEPVLFWLAVMPPTWAYFKHQAPLGRLELTSGEGQSLQLTLGGQGQDQQWGCETVNLQAGEKVLTQQVYNTLVYVHASRLPQSEVGITCPTRNLTYVIRPHEWRNVWLDGSSIILSGYVTRPDFSRRARRLGQGSLTWQGMRARVKHRILEVSELHPLKELLEQARLEGP